MAQREEKRNLETIPVGSLGIIPLEGCKTLGEKVDNYLVKWRTARESEHKDSLAFSGYQRDSYILQAKVPRFGTGEAKGVPLPVVNNTMCAPEAASAVDATRSFPGALSRFNPFSSTVSP